MKIGKLNPKITHQDVQNAVKRFLESGGIINTLPEEPSDIRPMVGGDRHQNFESLANLFSR